MSSRDERIKRYRAARERLLPRTSMRAFEALVAEALDDLPPLAQQKLENVAVVVEEWPPPGQDLLGLYEGINHLERGAGYHLVAPDRITLFWRPILAEVGDGGAEAIRREVQKTWYDGAV